MTSQKSRKQNGITRDRKPRKVREVKTLDNASGRRLFAYALAAGTAGVSAMALAHPAEAEIVFTPAHYSLTNGHISIDLNHDGSADFTLGTHTRNFSESIFYRYQDVRGLWGRSIEGFPGEAVAVKVGAEIGPKANFAIGEMVMAWGGSNFYLGFSEGGDFVNLATAGEQFLGVKLIVKGQTHFGWARFSRVSVVKGERIPDITVVLDGYAYETTPNKPIIAGRMHSEDETSSLEAPNATATSQCISTPATLGLLAQGVSGLVAWRREDEV